MNHKGLYIVLEGIDGSGKSTVAAMLTEYFKEKYPNQKVLSTYHPGSTALGRHLRKLVKNTSEIDPEIKIDNLTRQLLHFVDTISFHKTILEPELSKGSIVISDRCTYISAVIYGMATNLSLKDITNLFAIYPPCKADLMFIFDIDWQIAKRRANNRNSEDFFDNQKEEFFNKVTECYRNINHASLEQVVLTNQVATINNTHIIDSNREIEDVFKSIIPHVERTLAHKIEGA